MLTAGRSIAVTGGSGRLGRYIVRRLAAKNDVTVLDTTAPDVEGVRHVSADVLNHEQVREALSQTEMLIHLAAIPNPRTSSPDLCFKVNVLGTWTVLQAAENAGIQRTVVASSDSATGLHHNPVGWPPQYLPVDEAHPLRPSEVYSLTKEVTEAIARTQSLSSNMQIMALRPAHVVFEPEYPELRDRGSDVFNYHLWNFVAPEDVAEAFDLALATLSDTYDCCYIGAADGLNERPTLDLLRERFGYDPVLKKPETYERNETASVFDTSYAYERIGFKARINRAELFAKAGLT